MKAFTDEQLKSILSDDSLADHVKTGIANEYHYLNDLVRKVNESIKRAMMGKAIDSFAPNQPVNLIRFDRKDLILWLSHKDFHLFLYDYVMYRSGGQYFNHDDPLRYHGIEYRIDIKQKDGEVKITYTL